jgi:protein arginine N-methyltransferase 1
MLPDRCTISFAAIEDSSYKKSKLDFWNDVGYNINMSCVKQSVLQEPIVDIFNKNLINTSVCKVLDIDLYTCTKEDLDFSNQYELTFTRRDTLNGLAAWFDCYFEKLPNKVNFSTGIFTI